MANPKRIDIRIADNNIDPTLDKLRLFTGYGSTVRVATMRAAEQFAIFNKNNLKARGPNAQPITLEIRRIQ